MRFRFFGALIFLSCSEQSYFQKPDDNGFNQPQTLDDSGFNPLESESELEESESAWELCQEIPVTLMPIRPHVMLTLDKSGSMLNFWNHDANVDTPAVTQWSSLWTAVDTILTDFEEEFDFGMNVFPSLNATASYSDAACLVNPDVEVQVASINKAAIEAILPAQNSLEIYGGTPTTAGLTAAYNHLKTLDPLVPRVVILATDGAANCSSDAKDTSELFEAYDANLATLVDDAFQNDNIKTYVIGIATSDVVTPNQKDGNPDGINLYEKLNEISTLGGTPRPGPEKFYRADNQIELANALQAIVATASSCTIELPAPPPFPNQVVLKIGNEELQHVTDCSTENGWVYVEPSPYAAVEICGTACDSLKVNGSADIEYYCEAD